MQQRLSKPQPLFHALRVAADAEPLAASEAEQVEHLGCPVPSLAPCKALQAAVDVEQAWAGVILGEPVIFREVAHFAACLNTPHQPAEQVR